MVGVSRSRVVQMRGLLKLDKEIQTFILSVDRTDERLKVVTERRLRPLVQIRDREIQRKSFWEMMTEKALEF